jgi:ATP-dependent RNA helicase DeaD
MTDLTTTSPAASASSLPRSEPDATAAAPTFDVLPLSRELRETLAEIGYTHPTPVQLAVWEPATRGKDAVVQARTGTGKTAAFGLPIVDHIVRRSQANVQVLILSPTRELALQISSELERLSKRRNVSVVAIYGGAPMPRQVEQIAAGAQVVVGTPGRVLDHLRRGTIDPKHVRLVVLDESDEMLSMGFERELSAILEHMPKERQTLLFSATVPPDIERMAKTRLRTPEFITLSGDHIGALSILHYVYMVASDKIGALQRMIEVEDPESAVIFCNTKDETERVASALQRQGFDAAWLNGDLPQNDRERVMSATREGRLRFLVATDVAARGIDISHLTHVINHDFPQDAESYVHRTGRTGRAGRTGTAISLITPQDIGGLYLLRLTYKIRPIEKQIPSEGELKTRAEADFVAMLAEAFTAKEPHPEDLALARRLLTHDRIETILAGLLRDHLGARPTARDEASSARRATRAPRPEATPRPAAPKPPAKPIAAAPAPTLVPAAPTLVPAAPTLVPAAPTVAPAAPTVAPAAPTVAPAAPTLAPAAPRVAIVPAIVAAPVEPAAAPAAEASPQNVADRPRNEGRPEGRGPRGPRGRRDEGRERNGPPRSDEPRERSAQRSDEPRERSASPRNDEPRERSAQRSDEPRERSATPRSDEPRERSATPRVDELRERSAQRGDEIRERSATPRPDESRDRGRRREPRRINEDHVPVSAADGTLEGVTRASAPQRHAEFITWQPAAEEGDDDPILGDEARETRSRAPSPPFVTSLHAASSPGASPAHAAAAPRPESKSGGSNDAVAEALPDGDFGEIYVNVGRREGARAADFLRLLTERAGIDKLSIRRIRVRERNAFVSVRKDDVAKAVAALTGATIAGKIAAAEIAREREDDAAALDAPTQPMRTIAAAPVAREPATEADLSPPAPLAASEPAPQASLSDADAEPKPPSA